MLTTLFDIALHLDRHLQVLVANYGAWVYLILFLIIFCETGLVVTPFLPGDSLLFVAGTVAAAGGMNIHLLVVLLIIAAILGDAVNYGVGHYIGPRVFKSKESRWLNPRHLERAHAFYEHHGGKTIIIARFVPIIRTYAPFVAGAASMSYPKFALYNITGAVLWVVSLGYAGYFFGNIPVIKNNLTVVIIIIIILSIMPGVFEYLRHRRRNS
ncbi:MAG: DedA family protein [Betaproteobacteria bacterium]|nr:DedA family protein [Betaproteobacteria bacterium]MDH4293356.1 DedA family protein [Betaproteobacteria bacterium]MDH5341771.1 DedA family protein [Betaproteobacteria bacterium]